MDCLKPVKPSFQAVEAQGVLVLMKRLAETKAFPFPAVFDRAKEPVSKAGHNPQMPQAGPQGNEVALLLKRHNLGHQASLRQVGLEDLC